MHRAPWTRYIPTNLRVTFALQYFLNDAVLRHVGRYADCAALLGVRWHLVVHEDDGDPAHVAKWQRVLTGFGSNATLVLSRNIHESRGFNMAARMRDADVVIFLQDDEMPPEPPQCDWLGRTLAAFGRDRSLGAIGLRRAAPSGDWEFEIKRAGRPALGQSRLCDPLLEAQARYVIAADTAPFAVRRTAFLEVGAFPTALTPEGQPGHGVDTLLCILLWRAGWSVMHMPHHFANVIERTTAADERSNSASHKSFAQYWRLARYIKATHLYNLTDPWKNRTVRLIRRLNAQRLTPCAAQEARSKTVLRTETRA